MMSKREASPPSVSSCDAILNALALLDRSLQYASDTGSDRWDFAVEIHELKALGLSNCDFRWLASRGFIEHAREVTQVWASKRSYLATGSLSFTSETCFVLTEAGRRFVHGDFPFLPGVVPSQPDQETTGTNQKSPAPTDPAVPQANPNGFAIRSDALPVWDFDRRVLRVEDFVVKRFKWRAANQEFVLCAFQEEGWPFRIDDPLPPEPEQDSKRRLSDTIKCLNRKQEHELVHFRGDGTGEGVVWEFVQAGDAAERC